MLIELIEIFLGAFNYFFNAEDSDYLFFTELLVFLVCLIVLVTFCICLIVILHNVLKMFREWRF